MPWAAIARLMRMAALLALAVEAQAASQVSPLNTVCFDTSDRVRLCYAERLLDDPAKPLLVFIPGWTMPAAIWEKQLDHFAGKYSLVAFDPRGQGASGAPRAGYSLERRVRDIEELLERLPGRPVILIGWSLAVLESLAYVDRYGEGRLSGLVLVDNSIGEGPDGPPRSGESPFFRELRTHREATMRKFVAAMFHRDPGAEVRATILASALKTRVEDSIRLLSYPRPRAYWREVIQRISLPILYLITPRWSDQAGELTRKLPNASARVFANAGHALFWDEAEAFNRALEEFVAGLDPGAR